MGCSGSIVSGSDGRGTFVPQHHNISPVTTPPPADLISFATAIKEEDAEFFARTLIELSSNQFSARVAQKIKHILVSSDRDRRRPKSARGPKTFRSRTGTIHSHIVKQLLFRVHYSRQELDILFQEFSDIMQEEILDERHIRMFFRQHGVGERLVDLILESISYKPFVPSQVTNQRPLTGPMIESSTSTLTRQEPTRSQNSENVTKQSLDENALEHPRTPTPNQDKNTPQREKTPTNKTPRRGPKGPQLPPVDEEPRIKEMRVEHELNGVCACIQALSVLELGTNDEKMFFYFKLFDQNGDGILQADELQLFTSVMLESYQRVTGKSEDEMALRAIEVMMKDILAEIDADPEGGILIEDVLQHPKLQELWQKLQILNNASSNYQ